ncbi:MAG: GAF and ANTAR domain-containing protein [Candidatus Omnitrophica bacterium]|nr:GAF and ANTAR domain-containing protein [Candidatus Omnitrophota bacterium]
MKEKKPLFVKQLKALSKISEAITSDLYLEDILKLIVNVTAQVMDSKICSLFLLDEKKKELVVKATQSISEAYNKKQNLKLGEGIAGRVAQEGRPIIVLDVRKDPRYVNQSIAKKEGLCSLLSVPLKVKGRVIGVLNIYTANLHRFSKEEVDILMTVANQAAIVIENACLIVESKVIREELEARKFIERAKGVLMKEEKLSEEDAYRKIQKFAMDNRRTMREVAEVILLSYKMKKR